MSIRRDKKLRISLLLFALFSILSATSAIAQITVDAHLDTQGREKLTAGDVVILTVDLPAGSEGALPQNAEELKQGPVKHGQGRILWWRVDPSQANRLQFGLTSYKPGSFEIEPILFFKDGQTTAKTNPAQLKFESVGKNQNEDIYPPLGAPLPQWVWIILGITLAAFLAGVAVLIFAYLKKRRRLLDAKKYVPKILTPLEELEGILLSSKLRKMVKESKHKRVYFTVSEALKRFLARHYSIPAEECTTNELLSLLTGFSMERTRLERWRELFEHMDLIKFTDTLPSSAELEGLAAKAFELARESDFGGGGGR